MSCLRRISPQDHESKSTDSSSGRFNSSCFEILIFGCSQSAFYPRKSAVGFLVVSGGMKPQLFQTM